MKAFEKSQTYLLTRSDEGCIEIAGHGRYVLMYLDPTIRHIVGDVAWYKEMKVLKARAIAELRRMVAQEECINIEENIA